MKKKSGLKFILCLILLGGFGIGFNGSGNLALVYASSGSHGSEHGKVEHGGSDAAHGSDHTGTTHNSSAADIVSRTVSLYGLGGSLHSHGDAHGGGHGTGHGGASDIEPAMAGEIVQTPFVDRQESAYSSFPLLILLVPILAALLVAFFGREAKTRNAIAIAGTGIPFFMLLMLWKPVVSGLLIDGVLHKGVFASYTFLPGFDFTFKLDPANLLIALVTSLLWFASSFYASDYMTLEGKEQRFTFFNLLTLMADLGVLMAGDFLTLFFFFEGLVIYPYALMLHRENEKSARGATNYLFMGSVSGLILLLGMLLLYRATGSLSITALTPDVGAKISSGSKYLIALCMIIGFGAKAGLISLHIWMTTGYPNAPNAACSVSSGGMIKPGLMVSSGWLI